MLGISSRKGSISVGKVSTFENLQNLLNLVVLIMLQQHGDFMIVDPNGAFIVHESILFTKNKFTPYNKQFVLLLLSIIGH